jgi:hypothetical protein
MVGAGDALWDWARAALPLTVLDEGDTKAYGLVLDSFQGAFPDRPPDLLQPGETFALAVPAGTFVTQDLAQVGADAVYTSFDGDQLTVYRQPSPLLYRLVAHDQPEQVEVRLSGLPGSAAELARALYEVDPPDFIQVRTVRGALADPSLPVRVEQRGRYLDEFRNDRDRAVQQETNDDGLQVYTFAPDDVGEPFVRVEDGIGDETDPAAFPKRLRVAFYRDGTVREYLVTEPGDSLAQLARPDTTRWHAILPQVAGWQPAVVEPLAPFAPALNQAGALLPDRLLGLRFAPLTDQSKPPTTAGASCAGLPLALVLGGSGLAARRRRRAARSWTRCATSAASTSSTARRWHCSCCPRRRLSKSSRRPARISAGARSSSAIWSRSRRRRSSRRCTRRNSSREPGGQDMSEPHISRARIEARDTYVGEVERLYVMENQWWFWKERVQDAFDAGWRAAKRDSAQPPVFERAAAR